MKVASLFVIPEVGDLSQEISKEAIIQVTKIYPQRMYLLGIFFTLLTY